MGARQKLNRAHAIGAFVVAGLLALATRSAGVFLVGLGGLLALNVLAGNIRLSRRKH
jgi:hypothetical protein